MSQLSVPQNDDIGPDFLAGGGEMGALIRRMDWARTPLGPIETWPQSLRTTVSLCLSSNFPINIIWGPQHTQIYNDGYRIVCDAVHPRALGENYRVTWASAWPVIGESFERALAGERMYLENQRMFLMRLNGAPEETFFTFSHSPIRDESGGGGLFHPVTETTATMLSERRTRALRDLAAGLGVANDEADVARRTVEALSEFEFDLPFLLYYTLDAKGTCYRLAAHHGIAPGGAATPLSIQRDAAGPWPFSEALTGLRIVEVDDLPPILQGVACGPYEDPPTRGFVVPILVPAAERSPAVLVTAASSRLRLNADYRSFYDLLGVTIGSALATVRAREDERRRAEALAEIDRAKTAFFSNVSHEFRTPLTLMLGPLEEALADSERLMPEERLRVETAHRNGLRLLKLVNTLLDFSRIEAGRIEANYQPTDLCALTTDLASNFRAAMDRAGLRFTVECAPLPEPVYVDSDMWEKVVLNLLSNAYKFTFEGEVAVSLRPSEDGSAAELTVRDTGTGIPKAELPRLFERFHRVEGARGRTAEGSGIGLALVQELVKLHGGRIDVNSQANQGATFTVRVPLGTAHLPAEQTGRALARTSTNIRSRAFVEEALRWSGDRGEPESSESLSRTQLDEIASTAPAEDGGHRVLVADDNSDMRDYVRRLLTSAGYEVEVANDGEAALAAARQHAPDVVISDVMMPRLDGFGLLGAIRSDPALRETPVILLSARAGDEARVGGLDAGADDYLIKPFSARELLARVASNLHLARIRRESERRLREDAHILETLNRVGAAAAAELDLERAVQVVTDAATGLTGAAFGSFFYNMHDARGESYMLYTISGVPREAFSKFPMPRNTAVFGPTFRGEGIVRSEDITKDPRYGQSDTHHGMPKGHLPVKSYLAAPVVSRSGEVLGGLFFGHPQTGIFTERSERILAGIAPQAALAIDNARLYQAAQAEIAERRKAEAHQEFLLAELNHRVRNMLAVVMGIASQTARGSDSVKAFTDSFLGRLTSLSRAHAMLTDRNWSAMPLRKLVEAALEAHPGAEDGRIEMAGPDVTLKPKIAVSVSMILHELVTNAAKYGALAAPEGRIEVRWEVRDSGDAPDLRIGWAERGLRDVRPPSRRGFGTRMIEMSATHELGGAARLSYELDGLRCEIEFPLSQ